MPNPLIIGAILGPVIDRVLDRFAKRPEVSLEKKDVPMVREALKKEVVEELRPRIEHLTNEEPAYKSRVTQGNVVTVLAAIVTIMQLWSDEFVNSPEEYIAPATIIVGALWSLYGRWVAKKPLGD